MKKFRNIVAVALSALMLIALCACSKDKGPDVTGKYICYEESYDNGASFNEPYGESYIELKKAARAYTTSGLSLASSTPWTAITSRALYRSLAWRRPWKAPSRTA